MDRIRRFQRTMLLSLTALNTLVYCVSMDFSLSKTVVICLLTISMVATGILSVMAYSKLKMKKKALVKEQDNMRI